MASINSTTDEKDLKGPEPSIIKEYRIPLPISVDEYKIGQLYAVAEASKNETGGGDGVEVIENRPIERAEFPKIYDNYGPGQYTFKIIHLEKKVPSIISKIAPKGSLQIQERAWNCYPYCRTEYSNDDYMKEGFFVHIDTWHTPGNKDNENVHNLNQSELAKRQVVNIDIASDPIDPADYKEETDPTKFHSEKTGRGPLDKDTWQDTQMDPEKVMTCYKLYRIKFQWRLIQNKVESIIVGAVKKLLTNFHRELFCWIDHWFGMLMEDIRALEDKTKEDLDNTRKEGDVKGMKRK